MNDWIKVEDFNFEQGITNGAVVLVRGNNYGDESRGKHYIIAVLFNGCFYEIDTEADGEVVEVFSEELSHVTHFCFTYDPVTAKAVYK